MNAAFVFEYKVAEFPILGLEVGLNSLGQEGWELVSASPKYNGSVLCVLRRIKCLRVEADKAANEQLAKAAESLKKEEHIL